MNATPADHDRAFEIISDIHIIDLTYRDAQFVRAELADAIANAISAAVAEAVQAEQKNHDAWFARLINVWNTGNIGKVNVMLEEEAAAIRARSNGAAK